jgi:hypothetical protein
MLSLFLVVAPQAQGADAAERRRVEIGLKLFRATLAADQALARKVDDQGRLQVVLFFVGDRAAAVRFGETFLAQGALNGYPVRYSLSDHPALTNFVTQPPAGVFITESRVTTEFLKTLQDVCSQYSVVLFSPFEHHVQQGVATGVFIGARVQPYVNEQMLQHSGVELQAFFRQVAKRTR